MVNKVNCLFSFDLAKQRSVAVSESCRLTVVRMINLLDEQVKTVCLLFSFLFKLVSCVCLCVARKRFGGTNCLITSQFCVTRTSFPDAHANGGIAQSCKVREVT